MKPENESQSNVEKLSFSANERKEAFDNLAKAILNKLKQESNEKNELEEKVNKGDQKSHPLKRTKHRFNLFASFLLIVFIICISNIVTAQDYVQIGSGTSTNIHLPIEPYYGYSYSQSIFLASELGGAGTITSLEFNFTGSSLSNSNTWVIYIGHTSKNSFYDNYSWETVLTLNKVYDATFDDPGAGGWISFDITDFEYNGNSNLIIAVDENKSAYNGGSNDFYCSSVSGYRSIYYYNDNNNPDPTSPPTASSRLAYVPNTKLYITRGMTEGFEYGDFSAIDWQFSGNANWTIDNTNQYAGTYCAKSGSITHGQNTTMQVTMDCEAGDINFHYKVSSESGNDYLKFYIDGTEKNNWSGTAGWSSYSAAVTEGSHIFKWAYAKSSSGSSGSDCARVDNIQFPGSCPSAPYIGGSGTEASPYQISCRNDLKELSESSGDWDKFFIQTADITFNDADFESGGNFYNNGFFFDPIGNVDIQFTGTYDGDGYKINGLKINRVGEDYIGLFGYMWGANISYLSLEDVEIYGKSYVGGIAGRSYNYSSISNCKVTGYIDGVSSNVGGIAGMADVYSETEYCLTEITLEATSYYAGITGQNKDHSTIFCCYTQATLSGGGTAGGMAGYLYNSSVQQCYANVHISGTTSLGGLVGAFVGLSGTSNGSWIINSYAVPVFTTTQESYGGLIGVATYEPLVTASFWDSDVSGETNNPEGYGQAKTTLQMKDVATYTNIDPDEAWDFIDNPYNDANNYDTWGINPEENNGYPFLSWQGLNNQSSPTISTGSVTDITSYYATGNGEITYMGNSPITQHGICWNTETNPSISNNISEEGPSANGGTFSSIMSELNLNTTYYVKAYLTNASGTIYGDEVSFTTLNFTLPVVTTTDVSEITEVSASSGGNVTDDGGTEITERGVCWSTVQNPTTANSHTSDGTGSGVFSSSITGLLANTTYYVRAFASNISGIEYGNEKSFTTITGLPTISTQDISSIASVSAQCGGNITNTGGVEVTARGVCWSTASNPTLADNYTTDGSGPGLFSSIITGLNPETSYYVCAYATNSLGTAYGDENSFATTELIPASVTTNNVTQITPGSAVCGGNVLEDGGVEVTTKGAVWSTSAMPTILNNLGSTTDGNGMGSFVSNLTGLSENTIYYVRAYATTAFDTYYGAQYAFSTENDETFVEIGTGTDGAWRSPFAGSYKYGWSRTIYLQSELGPEPLTIYKIAYNYKFAPNTTVDNHKIYIKHTTEDAFSSSVYEDETSYTQVFDGEIIFKDDEYPYPWVEILLDTPFEYNGTDNLVIYYQNHSNTSLGGSFRFIGTEQENRVIYRHDSYYFPTSNGYYDSYTPNIRMYNYPDGAPGVPSNPTPTSGTTEVYPVSGSISWDFGVNTETYDLWLGPTDNMVKIIEGGIAGEYGNYDYTNLELDEEYTWKIMAYNDSKMCAEGPRWNFTTRLLDDMVQIGDGAYTDKDMPIDPYSQYSYTQSWYAESAFNSPGSGKRIEYIYYNYHVYGSINDRSDDWAIYMTTSSNTGLSSYVDISEFTKVFDGDTDFELCEDDGWLEIKLDTPYTYDPDNDGNLIIAVDENSQGSSTSSSNYFYNDKNSSYYVGCYYNSYNSIDPENPPSGYYSLYYPNTRFQFANVPSGPEMRYYPTSADIGITNIGTYSETQTITVQNYGIGVLSINSIEMSGINSEQFVLTDNNNYPLSLSANESITVDVKFQPTSAGEKTASLIIQSDAKTEHSVSLSGEGFDPEFTAFPYNQDFETSVGSGIPQDWNTIDNTNDLYAGIFKIGSGSPVDISMKITNSSILGDYDIMLVSPPTSMDVSGSDVIFYCTAYHPGNEILVGTMTDVMDPESFTTIESVCIDDDANPSNIYVVHLPETTSSFTYFAFKHKLTETNDHFYIDDFKWTNIPEFEISPESYNFDTINMGNMSGSATFTIKNDGGGTLTIEEGDVSISGTHADEFVLLDENSYPISLTAYQSYTLQVAYAPITEGDHVANLMLTANAKEIHNVPLSGTGRDAYIKSFPYTQNFDDVTAPEMPLGWCGYDDTGEGNIVNASYYNYLINSPPNSAYVNNGDATSGNIMLVSPPTLLSTENTRVRFLIKSFSGTQNISVGTLSDPTNPETFTLLSTIVANETFTEHVVHINDASKSQTLIAFKHELAEADQIFYIDNFTWEEFPDTPNYEVSPEILSFGKTYVLSTPEAETVSIVNTGGGTLTITNLTIAGINSDQFNLTDAFTSNIELAADDTLWVDVAFTPTSEGEKTANLSVVTTETGTHTIQLSGQATEEYLYYPPGSGFYYSLDYWNSYTEQGWTPVTIPESLKVTYVTVEYNYETESSYENGTFNLKSPLETDIEFAQGQIDGTYEININDFNDQSMTGDWILWLGDNKGYGGHNAGDIVLHFGCITPGEPEAITNPVPADNATGITTSGTLTWDFGANTQTYDLWFGPLNSMSKVVSQASAEASGSFAYSGIESASEYQWMIVGYNDLGKTQMCTWSFETELPDGMVQIGDGTELSTYMPVIVYENYSISQSLYYPSDFGVVGSTKRIEKIYYNYHFQSTVDESGLWSVYMGTTDVAPQTSFINSSNLTQVFEGNVGLENLSGTGWCEIILDVPFVYNPATDNNLVVLVDENDPGDDSEGNKFFTDIQSIKTTLFYYSDSYNLDPANPPTYVSSSYNYPNTRFLFQDVPTGPEFKLTPQSKDFDTVNIAHTSSAQIFTIQNYGIGTMTLNSVSINGSGAANFVLTDENTYPLSLGPNETVTVEVTFEPIETETLLAELSIVTEAKTTYTACLTGYCSNPNFGGGAMAEGGYFFANSTQWAQDAPQQPVYSWYDNQTGGTNEGILIPNTEIEGYAANGYTAEMAIFDDNSSFSFFRKNYNNLYIGVDGIIGFLEEGAIRFSPYSSGEIPSTEPTRYQHNMIAWFWSDLNYDPDYDPDVHIRISRLSDRTVITFWHFTFSSSYSKYITAQVCIYKTGDIIVMYNSDNSDFLTIHVPTIGIENFDGTEGVGYHYSTNGGDFQDDGGNLALAFYAPAEYTWNGSFNTDWNTTENWNLSTIPGNHNNVIIPNGLSRYPVIAGGEGGNCYDLSLENEGSLTIENGGSLITHGDISNEGSISIHRSFADDQWHLISSPVSNAVAGVFTGTYLQSYDEITGTWEDIGSYSTPLLPCQGYGVWNDSGKGDFVFTGTPNNGDMSISLSTQHLHGFNLVGNPYPSSIDWESVISDQNNLNNAVYCYDPALGDHGQYVSYIGGVGDARYIPPVQGFFISAYDTGTITLNNAHRTHTGSSSFFKSKELPDHYLKIQITKNDKIMDKFFLRFNDQASPNYDGNFDALKMSSNSSIQCYSFAGDNILSIDQRPECPEVQLGFTSENGGFFSFNLLESTDFSEVLVYDAKLEKSFDLLKGNYDFTWDINDSETRFTLHMNSIGIKENQMADDDILIYADNDQIFIKGAEQGKVQVMDIIGRIVLQQEIFGSGLITIPVNLQTGIYVVMVRNGKDVKTEKVFIK